MMPTGFIYSVELDVGRKNMPTSHKMTLLIQVVMSVWSEVAVLSELDQNPLLLCPHKHTYTVVLNKSKLEITNTYSFNSRYLVLISKGE